jgi:hypothetical protein
MPKGLRLILNCLAFNEAALCLSSEYYSECGALAYLALLHIYGAMMVLLYYAAGEREAEAPAPLLGGKAGCEYLFYLVARYALAAVLHIYPHLLGRVSNCYVYRALTAHGVEGVAH